jgi:hypothetical protein
MAANPVGSRKGTSTALPGAAGGVRLFNVGITRARHKLYLIANLAAVEKARSGPLHAVRLLRDSGSIHVVRAAEILGLPSAPEDDPVAGDIWHALRNHATLIDLFDEDVLPEELCRRFDEATERIWLWSPWVGRRAEQLLPHLIDAQNRDVRVHPVVLPPDQVNRHLKSRHEQIATQVPKTVYFADEHQKLVVIDRGLTFIGSMNVLAHVPGGRHEIMALFQSSTLADRILEHERAAEIANPPRCQQCGAEVRLLQTRTGPDRERRLYWVCSPRLNGGCGWMRPFPDKAGTRNQPRRRRHGTT